MIKKIKSEILESLGLTFKGKLEIWYQKNRSFKIDLIIIFITAWVILKSNSKIYERVFKTLPKRDF